MKGKDNMKMDSKKVKCVQKGKGIYLKMYL